ncbi:6-phosphogluconolactonase [Sinimarinibacterium thermocellulolyticum]|uniref:6-phosphogluconolactonase n=1 Tax=Sinimarinibacterium thermocellulolyticum TaxID=3170016 RepID=A0ABV2A8H0_9GAMM
MSEAVWTLHADAAQMAQAVADEVAALLRERLQASGQALLALPGGRTPVAAFERLARAPLDWSRVTLIPTDERLVPETHALSNVVLLRRHFDRTGARIVPLLDAEPDPHHAAGERADRVLQTLPWPPDLVWLGVGSDGHTASIFPGPDLHAALDAPAQRRAIGVLPDPLPAEAPVARVTLTRAAIASARRLLLTLTGEAKRAVVTRALRGDPPDSPIGRVLASARMPVAIHWSPT